MKYEDGGFLWGATYSPHVKTRATAAANITTVVIHPRMLAQGLFTRSFMTLRLLAISMITISNGGARKPFTTAAKKSALIGLMPTKLISMPTRVEAMITP